jgi:chemotaxis signal transduction protein
MSEAAASVAQAASDTDRTAQGIICGSWAYACEYGWARNIVERFEWVAVPRSPVWLLGATNIEGEVIPVVDLSLYAHPNTAGTQITKQHRLLVVGVGAQAVALLFSQRPVMLRYAPQKSPGYLPPRIKPLARGVAVSATGEQYIDLDPHTFIERLSLEL